jgi:putative ABC transport system permease protein
MMTGFWRDARYALRLLAREPRPSAISMLTLALGIGATTALFSLTNAWLLRPLPFRDAGRLVAVWETIPSASVFENTPAPALLYDWKARARTIEQLAALTTGSANLSGSGEPERLSAIIATPNLLDVLGVPPAIGRAFTADATDGADREEALLTYPFWQRRFAGDPGVLGTTLTLNGRPVRVIGVLPRGVEIMNLTADLWRPLRFTAAEQTNLSRYLWVIGRVRTGTSVAQASADVDAIARSRSNGDLGARAVALHEQTVGSLGHDLPVLLGATAVLLLIACANVASLTLARAASRRNEFLVRAALGAGRARIARQVLTEGLMLGLAGGAAGLLVSAWLVRGFQAWLPQADSLPDVGLLDARVFAFALAVSMLTAVLFAIAPAVQCASKDVMTGLRAGARSVSAGLVPLRLLAALEVALAVALLISAGLVGRSFVRLARLDLGFTPDGVVTFELPRTSGDRERPGSPFHDELLRRLREAPGMRSAAVTQALPLKSFGYGSGFPVEGATGAEGSLLANWRIVSAQYFETIGLPLRQGRPFDARDGSGGARVAIVSESYARRAWPGGASPIGRRIGWATLEHPMTVVGVAADVRLSPASAPSPHVYMPYTQVAGYLPDQLAVRGAFGDAQAIDTVRRAVWSIDPLQPVANIRTMDALLWRLLGRRRFQLTLWAAFAFLAVSLAVIGVYGVVSYLVRQSTKEIGIRLALGAPPSSLRWLVLRQGTGVAAGGIAAGLLLAYWSAGLVKGFLVAVEPRDPWIYGAVAVLAAAATLAACALPARRAARVDPLATLRLD